MQGGGTIEASSLVNIDSTSLIVTDGVTLHLPLVTSWEHATTGSNQVAIWRAEGHGSRLQFGDLLRVANGTHSSARIRLEAISGGTLDLSSVETIADGDQGNQSFRRIELVSEGVGSRIDLSHLKSFTDRFSGSLTGSNRFSTVESRYGGTVDFSAGDASALSGVWASVESLGRLTGRVQLETDSILEGNGIVTGEIIAHGTIKPNGKLVVQGDLFVGPTGVLDFEIGGLIPVVDHDVLEVSGDSSLSGLVRLTRSDNHDPRPGDSYTVMTYSSRDGTPLYDGLDFGTQILSPEYGPTTLEFVAGFSSGAAVISMTASDSASDSDGPFVVVEFDEPIDPASISPADVVLRGPSDVSVPVGSVQFADETMRRLVIRPDRQAYRDGAYTLTVGPQIFDLVGNPMNQDGDEINGESSDDLFTGTFVWQLPDLVLGEPTLAAFDRGLRAGQRVAVVV